MVPLVSPIEVDMAKAFLKHIRPHFSGSLDGRPFAKVSTDSSGKRFVAKGFIDTRRGPAVRLSSKWGELGSGFVWYLKSAASEWQDVDEKITHKIDGLKLTIKVEFTAADGKHTALFVATGKP
jgi:hypothetical protein